MPSSLRPSCRTRGLLTAARARASIACALAVTLAACSRGEPLPPLYGKLSVSAAGFPTGTTPRILVATPSGSTMVVMGGGTLTELVSGEYTLTAQPVTADGATYGASPATQTAIVSANEAPTRVAFEYGVVTGALAVNIGGVPAGSTPTVTISGPGVERTITTSQTMKGLAPGTYRVSTTPVMNAGRVYAPQQTTQEIAVAAGLTPAAATISFNLASGGMDIDVGGLPAGVNAAVTVSGPAGYSKTLAASEVLANLQPGTYTLIAADISLSGNIYSATPPTQLVEVGPSLTAARALVRYAVGSGGIAVAITGLPQNLAASATLVGPSGFSRSLTATATFTGLATGNYTLTASPVTDGVNTYVPTPATQTIAVTPSLVASPAAVSYALASGAVAVSVVGLPAGVAPDVTILGPGNYSRALPGSETLAGLPNGTYTILANNVRSNGFWVPTPAGQSVTVVAGQTATATVTYAPEQTPSLNLYIDGMYIVQSTQAYAGTVPLLAGRTGLLRVFVRANQLNYVQPKLRVRLYNGTTLLNTYTLDAPTLAVPIIVYEAEMVASYTLQIPGAVIQPGLRVLADVDPANAVYEENELDNMFPRSGVPLAMDVRTAPPLKLRFVPITHTDTMGPTTTGAVSEATKAQFLASPRQLLPLGDIDADVRGAYTSGVTLYPDDRNGAWSQLLSEMNALRVAEASDRFYYGVVRTSYTSGVTGASYTPGFAAVGWDFLPNASWAMAHQLGHNFGRLDTPCGNRTWDSSYPYLNGSIGVFGWDETSNLIKVAGLPDVMGNCNSPWVSDYTFTGVMNFRAASAAAASRTPAGAQAPRPSLLVWGRLHAGQLVLEPAFTLTTRPALPTASGPFLLEGLAADGQRVFAYSFDGQRVGDAPGGDRHFAFAIPVDQATESRLATLRLSSGGHAVVRRLGGAGAATADAASRAARAEVLDAGTVRITWPGADAPAALVRDAHTGQVLSIARGGAVDVRTRARDLDVVLSDGVRSAFRRLSVRAPMR